MQSDTLFREVQVEAFVKDSIREDVVATIADFDGNKENDLFIGVGGADFFGEMNQLLNKYFLQKDGAFENADVPASYHNAAVLGPQDVDGDGDLDLFVGNQSVSNDFGKIPTSFLLQNNAGKFSVAQQESLNNLGMITDAIWEDFDGDGNADLVVVGEWMAPKFFTNDQGKLREVSVIDEELNGLWQSIEAFDIDQDGDLDMLHAECPACTNREASLYENINNNSFEFHSIIFEHRGLPRFQSICLEHTLKGRPSRLWFKVRVFHTVDRVEQAIQSAGIYHPSSIRGTPVCVDDATPGQLADVFGELPVYLQMIE